ncbi:hypothetical protein ACFLT7_07130 [candidate division KSB1 bacterium]
MKARINLVFVLLLPLLAAALIIGCGGGPKVSDGWKVIGPGGGGGIFLPTISPHDPDLMMTHCDMTAAYISHDGGDNWRMVNLWNVPEDFEFDPGDPDVIYAAVRGYLHSEGRGSGLSILYRSEDRGERWRAVYPRVEDAEAIDGKIQGQNLLPSQIIPGAFDGTINTVRVDPSDSDRIYVGMAPLVSYISGAGGGERQSAFLIGSLDRGRSWKKLADLPGRSVLKIVPGSKVGRPNELLAFTGEGCVRVDTNSGRTTSVKVPVKRIIAAEAGSGGKGGGTILYILSGLERSGKKISGGVYRSSDWGDTWIQANDGLFDGVPEGDAPGHRALGVCEGSPEVVYISARNGRSARNVEGAWLFGIFKTENGGENWKPVWLSNSDGYITDNHESGWLDGTYGPSWGGNPIDLGVAPGDPDLCIGSDNGRAYRTTDGGANWKQIHSHKNSDGSWSTSGLNVTTNYGVHFDPSRKDHIFISYTDIGLFHSYDGGKSWRHSVEGIPNPWVNTCYWMEFDPEVEGRAWSVWGNAHDLPRDKMFGPGGFERYVGGVAVSDDGGETWRKSNFGIPENSVGTDVTVDPDSPKDARILYACMFDRGVYKSTDGGESWSEANNGLGSNRYAWQTRLNSEGRLFVLMSRGRLVEGDRRARKTTTVAGELYYSDDKAATWKPLAIPAAENAPHDLQIDPDNPKRMYLSCWARSENGRDVAGGLYRTDDGGNNWKLVFNEARRVNSAAIDPWDNNTIYLNTFENAAYRSDDGGDSWRRIEGYRFKWGQRAIPDLNNPGMLFLTTYGGSVFHGPADGVPGGFEDIENIPAGWW